MWQALIPVVTLVVLIYVSVVTLEMDPHLALIMAAAVAAGVGIGVGYSWKEMEEGMVQGIMIGMRAILILLVIGMLIGTWILAGIVPVMVDYGLRLMAPSFFLAAACVICGVVSIATGSSWTTAGTVGVALIGVGQGLGVPAPMVAGAVISGAYFGDKMSPLSDTTNLAPAVAGAELFEHVRYMLHTTIPGLVIALIGYTILGLSMQGQATDTGAVTLIRETLGAQFKLSPVLLLPPLLVVGMVIFRLPALPALMGGVALGGVLAVVIQGAELGALVDAALNGFKPSSGVASVDALLENGGLFNMMSTVALVICSLGFGGVMERTGMLGVLAGSVIRLARSTGSLVATTVATCVGMNVLAPDQYLSIVVPGRMYREAYRKQGLEPRLLSRTLEDSGTLTSPLVGWNTCGAFMSQTLGVGALSYAPYAFLNLSTPIIAIVIAFMGWGIVVSPRQRPTTVHGERGGERRFSPAKGP